MIKDLKHKKITLITSHQGKADQVSKILSYPVSHKSLELHEIQSLDPKEVIEHKVSEAFKLLKAPVLVEDTSIVIEEFGALPGPFIKYFHQEIGNKKICELLDNRNRAASATTSLGYHDGVKVHIFQGVIKGNLADKPRGENGFGFDSIFIPEGFKQTRAEMEVKDYFISSPRRIALEKLAEYLKNEEL